MVTLPLYRSSNVVYDAAHTKSTSCIGVDFYIGEQRIRSNKKGFARSARPSKKQSIIIGSCLFLLFPVPLIGCPANFHIRCISESEEVDAFGTERQQVKHKEEEENQTDVASLINQNEKAVEFGTSQPDCRKRLDGDGHSFEKRCKQGTAGQRSDRSKVDRNSDENYQEQSGEKTGARHDEYDNSQRGDSDCYCIGIFILSQSTEHVSPVLEVNN